MKTMKKDTKKLLIGGSAVALLAAIFWPKEAKAQTPAPTPQPPTPPSSEPPTQPPTQPPPAPTPPASQAPTTPPIADPSTFQAPILPVAANAVIRTFDVKTMKWLDPEWVDLQPSDILDANGMPQLDLPKLFAKLTSYHPTYPPYQEVQLFYYLGGKWYFFQRFDNYVSPASKFARGMLSWTWVRVWQWTANGWTLANDSGPQQSAVSAQSLASAIKDQVTPPYYFSQAFQWSASMQTWTLAATAKNY